MAENSAIEWTQHTWNCWQGCHKVSEGCANCYMYRDKKRYGQDPTKVVRSAKNTFNMPLRLKDPAHVFVCSWSDFFIADADDWRAEAWEIIRKTPHLTYQLLTKRPENIADRLPADWGSGYSNVWLGVTAENQEMLDKRWSYLRDIPARVRFVSVEPMLGPVDLQRPLEGWDVEAAHDPCCDGNCYNCPVPLQVETPRLDWVICGCESGPNRRPAEIDWIRGLKGQCVSANVPFFLKQAEINGQLVKMPELDGKVWAQFPEVQP